MNKGQNAGGPKTGRIQRRWILVLVVALLVVSGLVAARMSRQGGSTASTGDTITAKRGQMVITVTQGGSIRAHKSIEYRCQVERRGTEVSILSIVPGGTYITQQDVENGMILVQLDSSQLEQQLIQEKMELAGARQNAISEKEAYDIQVIQNESDIADAQLRMRFALLDLQKYLGAKLAERLVSDVNEASNLTEHVAPLLVDVHSDPNVLGNSAAAQGLKKLNDDIVLAEGNLRTAQATLVGTEKLHDANYVSDLDLQRDRLAVTNREFAEQNAGVSLDLFWRYDFPKTAEQYLSDYIETGRRLARTYAQCRSRLAQAEAKLANAQERLHAQESRVTELEQQIAYCTIRAKAPGLVIYGTGGSEDAFRAMRGRGGSGSGIIAEGETVYQGQTLISMPDTAAMVAEISVHETEVDKVRPGQPATIVMDAFPDKVLHGRVIEVAPLPDQQRGWMNPDLKVYQTLVSIEGTHDFLRTRMSCKVEILVQQLNDVVYVPIQVVANRGGQKVCYIMNGRSTEERAVQTGAFNDVFVQIVDGLQEGEEVLLNPPSFTQAGSQLAFETQQFILPGAAPDANVALAVVQPAVAEQPPQVGQPKTENEGADRRSLRARRDEMTDEQRQQMRQRRSRRDGQNPAGAVAPNDIPAQ